MCIAFHDSDDIMEVRAKTKLAEETLNIDFETDVVERKRKYTKLIDWYMPKIMKYWIYF